MPPARIAIIVTKMDEGGAINVALQLAAGLRSRGHEVEIWFLYVSRAVLLHEPGVRAMLPRPPSGLADYLRIVRHLHTALRRFRPHGVQGVMPLANIVGLGLARSIGCPSRVASQHQPWPTLNPVMQALDRLAGSSGIYTANVSVSEAVRASFERHPASYRERMVVIPNGVAERISPLSQEAARASFNLPDAVPLLGTIGRLVPEKNHGFLLDVISRLPGAHLAIGGAGELEADLRRKIRELGLSGRVHLPGQLPAGRVPDLLRTLDLFLFPSVFEGMPIALLEAMMAGLPIVASDIPANREVASGASVIVDTASADSWAAEIRRLIESPEACRHLGAAAGLRARNYTNDAMIDAYERLLLASAGSETGRP